MEKLFAWIFVYSVYKRGRSSHQSCCVKKIVLKDFSKFLGNDLSQSRFFIRVSGLRPGTLKKIFQYSCFPVNFAKVFRVHLWKGREYFNQNGI